MKDIKVLKKKLFLIEGALILFENEIYKVVENNSNKSVIVNNKDIKKSVLNSELKPIDLTEKWLLNFNLNKNHKITSIETNVEWIIRQTENGIYYITILNEQTLNESTVIGLKYVHDLQEWIFRLSKRTITLF
ncbi:hypothetical protein [Polaribacter sp.]|uniref:hypothetical protein n=1 Tax=Polaribacter sp. TaxID=1920175 RepID=UPI00404824F5